MTLLRWLVFSFFRLFYRPEVVGLENIPRTGGAVIASNHQSFIDAMLITSILDRPVRFLISRKVMGAWWIWPFAKVTGAIPIDRDAGPRALVEALREAHEEVARGGLVALFPEGMISRIGPVLPFQRGYEKILKGLDAPLIPVAVDGGMETRWGRLDGAGKRVTRAIKRGRRVPLRVAIGAPVPSGTKPPELRQAVVEEMRRAFELRRLDERTLHASAIRQLRRRPFAQLFGDHTSGGPLPNYKILAGLVALGEKLRPRIGEEEVVGVMLPPTIAGILVNVFLAAAGRVSANLNHTLTPKILDEIRRETNMRVVITSRVFLEKAQVTLPEGLQTILLEDIRREIGGMDRLRAMVLGLLAPVALLERRMGRAHPARLDEVATLLYSSGSTGTPKGIPLTHWNVIANVRGALLSVRPPDDGRLLGALPLFHSFGYTVALWLPLLGSFATTWHPNPLDARGVAESIARNRVTHLFSTPTFLAQYARRVERAEFATLTYVITGAEKLRDSVSDAFEKQFGIRPVEGYGCTETGPVVSLTARDVGHHTGDVQLAGKRGSVSLPIPGVAVRVVDPETGARRAFGETGLLLVTGPSILSGYYKRDDLTAAALVDRWYRTGDLASVDEDGFIFIGDRLSRFSKIAGEMVPHGRIEEALQAAAGESEACFAIAGVPDEKRGERLVVLTTLGADRVRAALEELARPECGIPVLWIPRERDVVKVEAIPVLGSGKKDLQRIKEMALDAARREGKKEAPSNEDGKGTT